MHMIVALMLAAAQPAGTPAPDWRPVGTARDQFALFYDGARIERGPEVVTIWLKTEAARAPETAPRAISRVEIRCAAAMLRVVETITYGTDGAILRTDSVAQPFESIPPGSHVAVIRQAVC